MLLGVEELLLKPRVFVHISVETLGVHAPAPPPPTASSPAAVVPAGIARGRAGVSPLPAEKRKAKSGGQGIGIRETARGILVKGDRNNILQGRTGLRVGDIAPLRHIKNKARG